MLLFATFFKQTLVVIMIMKIVMGMVQKVIVKFGNDDVATLGTIKMAAAMDVAGFWRYRYRRKTVEEKKK